MPGSPLFLTRNEQVSGSSPLVGSLFYLQNPYKRKAHDVGVGGFVSSTSAVDYYPLRPYPRRYTFPCWVSSASSGQASWLCWRVQAGIGLTSTGYHKRSRG